MIVEIIYRDRPHSMFETQPPGPAETCIATEIRLSLEPDGLWIEADRYEMGSARDRSAPVAVRRRWWRLLDASRDELSSAEAILRDGKTAWWRLSDGFVNDCLLAAADRKWLEYGGRERRRQNPQGRLATRAREPVRTHLRAMRGHGCDARGEGRGRARRWGNRGGGL